MKQYTSDKIRNVTLLGHGNSGKTSLLEAILFDKKVTGRLGSVDDGTTVSDYSKEEIQRKFTISTSLVPMEWADKKINFLDTPGYFDFVGETIGALSISGGAVIVIDASSGIEVGTEKAWQYTEQRKMPRILFINKMDKENINYVQLIEKLKAEFGAKIAPFVVPIGDDEEFKGYVNVVDMQGRIIEGDKVFDAEIPEELNERVTTVREMLIESVAESDEALLEKFFEGEEFTEEEIRLGLRKGVLNGEVVPVVVGSASKLVGITMLLDMITDYLPTPLEAGGGVVKAFKEGTQEEVEIAVDPAGPFSAQVFKTIVDPFIGKISLFKVISGSLKKEMEVYNTNKETTERIGNVFYLMGKKQIEATEIGTGDIGAVAKLSVTQSGDTLCDKKRKIKFAPIPFLSPGLFKAIQPKSKGDEDKIGTALQRLNEEDPTFSITRNSVTKQMIIGGQGTMQLLVIVDKLKEAFDVEVEMIPQKIAYRESIKGTVTQQGKYKKQSGGAGQYGDVVIQFEPSDEDFVFEEKIFGGSVPRNYFPSVEKGLEEALERGPLAGFPVVGLKATLLDGSYHAVDSSDIAFKVAASLAFKEGLPKANPILLEPIMHLEITIPDDYMGDIIGDLNKRRGRILGMQPSEGGGQTVFAEAPEAELFSYSSDLRSMTQARGNFTVTFERYDEVPAMITEKVIEEVKKED
ncbi:MAG: elongation factor G [Tissierellia bacterium]|nr:elongation factor G [Tissierellia bacterium]